MDCKMASFDYFLSLLIVVSLVYPALTDRCVSNYTVFLNGGALATKTNSCPIKKPYFSNVPPKKGVLLEDGACIARGYKKNIVKSTSGIFEGGKLSTHDAEKQGWNCYPKNNGWNRTECKLRQTLVYTNIQDYVVRDINDLKRTVTLDLSLALMWMDHGIKTWIPKNEEQKRIGAIGLPHERINDIWNPHIHIYDLADYSAYKRSLNIVSLNVLISNYLDPRNGICLYGPMVQYEMDAKITFYCDFDYSSYPKDESICKFRFGGQRTNLKFTLGSNNNVTSEGDRKNHIGYFDIAGKVVEESITKNGKMIQVLGLDIKVKRGIQPFILQYYVPCATITVVSQFSFFIPFTAIPGRVALLVTQFLTLTSLFIHQMGQSPTGSAMDNLALYILVSLFFVVGMMVEFAIALLLYRRNTDHLHKKNETGCINPESRKDSKSSVLERRNGSLRGETYLERQERKQREQLWPHISSNTVDIIASILFPFAYIIFNAAYWASLE